MKQPLSSYRIFYTVACEGNISRAAQLLYISQPAISKAIRRLEEALDTQLFCEAPEACGLQTPDRFSSPMCVRPLRP